MSVAPIGELFGWLFALELPNSQAGFKVTGNLVCVSFGQDVALEILTLDHICRQMRKLFCEDIMCLYK